ncbi:hypothetical protein SFRURICE_018922 [Spodoptera frugiperda]|nr:hypothetical protein SFRURICE_018922 [Spodoptera frugiperda]
MLLYVVSRLRIVTPFIPEEVGPVVHITARNATVQCTPTYYHLRYKLRAIANNRKKNSNAILDLGIDPETPCSAVALATTRPMKQNWKLT